MNREEEDEVRKYFKECIEVGAKRIKCVKKIQESYNVPTEYLVRIWGRITSNNLYHNDENKAIRAKRKKTKREFSSLNYKQTKKMGLMINEFINDGENPDALKKLILNEYSDELDDNEKSKIRRYIVAALDNKRKEKSVTVQLNKKPDDAILAAEYIMDGMFKKTVLTNNCNEVIISYKIGRNVYNLVQFVKLAREKEGLGI